MNKLEKKYADNLELKRLAGEIVSWKYEPREFELAHRCTYTPDFEVVFSVGMQDDRIEYHETKGWMRDDAAVKLKVAARMFPQYTFVLVKWDPKKGWTFKDIPK